MSKVCSVIGNHLDLPSVFTEHRVVYTVGEYVEENTNLQMQYTIKYLLWLEFFMKYFLKIRLFQIFEDIVLHISVESPKDIQKCKTVSWQQEGTNCAEILMIFPDGERDTILIDSPLVWRSILSCKLQLLYNLKPVYIQLSFSSKSTVFSHTWR